MCIRQECTCRHAILNMNSGEAHPPTSTAVGTGVRYTKNKNRLYLNTSTETHTHTHTHTDTQTSAQTHRHKHRRTGTGASKCVPKPLKTKIQIQDKSNPKSQPPDPKNPTHATEQTHTLVVPALECVLHNYTRNSANTHAIRSIGTSLHFTLISRSFHTHFTPAHELSHGNLFHFPALDNVDRCLERLRVGIQRLLLS